MNTETTQEEINVLNGLASAWNQFLKLPDKHPDDLAEFRQAIHAAQGVIACRIAKRADPQIWK